MNLRSSEVVPLNVAKVLLLPPALEKPHKYSRLRQKILVFKSRFFNRFLNLGLVGQKNENKPGDFRWKKLLFFWWLRFSGTILYHFGSIFGHNSAFIFVLVKVPKVCATERSSPPPVSSGSKRFWGAWKHLCDFCDTFFCWTVLIFSSEFFLVEAGFWGGSFILYLKSNEHTGFVARAMIPVRNTKKWRQNALKTRQNDMKTPTRHPKIEDWSKLTTMLPHRGPPCWYPNAFRIVPT